MGFRWLAIVFSITAMVLILSCPRSALAQPRGGGSRSGPAVTPPGSTPVLTFDSDDADEQADAFTAALRAKVKSTPGWVLSDNAFTMGILTAALKCRVDAPCLQKVGDQLKTDKFFWGKVARAGKGQVVVEAHYWQRAKHDSVVKETYSDDLRDPHSEALKKIATRIFERLTNTLTTGMVAVQAGKGEGAVMVDGAAAGTLSGGAALLELKAGQHTVEVHVPGYLPVRQTVNVSIGAETPLALTLVPEPGATPPPSGEPTPTPEPPPSGGRRVLAYTLIGGGVVAGVVATIFATQWFHKQAQVDDARANQYGLTSPAGATIHVDDPCAYPRKPENGATANANLDTACNLAPDAKTLSTIAWVTGGVGAALIGSGVVLLVTGNANGETRAAARKPKWSLTPLVGRREGMLRFGVDF